MALSPGLFARARLPRTLPPTTGPVGNGMDNDPSDVEAVKRGLNALGYYTVPDYGFTGFIDQATTDAVKRFQQDNGLKQDGWLGKDGETYTAINERLGQLPQGVDPKAEGTQSAESNTPAKASTLATPASSSSGFKRQNLLEGQPPSKADGWITKVLFQEGDLSPGPVAPPTNRPSAPAPVGPTPNPGAPAPSINEPVVPETGLGSVIGRLFGLNAIKDSLKGEPTDDGNLGHPARADAQKTHRKLDRKYGSADQIEEAGRVREAQQATEAAANAEALVKADSVKGAPNQSISIADAFRLDGPFRKPGDNADQSELKSSTASSSSPMRRERPSRKVWRTASVGDSCLGNTRVGDGGAVR